jgi:hypothetical protein
MWQSTGRFDKKTGGRIWRCRNHPEKYPVYQTELPPQGLGVPPNILYVDIEYGKMRVWLYDLYGERNKHISKDMIDRHKFMTNWAAAWVSPQTYKITGGIFSGVVTQAEAKKANDKRILKPLFQLLDECDYVCGHNSQSFDVKVLKWRFFLYNMGYPSASKQVDTFKLAGAGRPESRALDYLLKRKGYAGKQHKLSDDEWREICEKGTPSLLAKADRYCRADVRGGVDLLREYVRAEEMSGRVVFR